MLQRLRKEWLAVRQAWAAAVLLPCLSVMHPLLWSMGLTLCAVSYSLLVASVFGHDYAHGTWPWLLAQPVSRRRLWYEKQLVTALALGSAVAAFVLVRTLTLPLTVTGLEAILGSASIGLLAWLTTPALTLGLRNTLAAGVFTPILPLVLGIGCWWAGEALMSGRAEILTGGEAVFNFVGLPVAVYALLMYVYGCRLFARMEAVDPPPREVGASWFHLERLLGGLAMGKNRRWWAFVVKELRFQRPNFVLAALFVVAFLSALVYRRSGGTEVAAVFAPFLIYGLFAPVLIGAVTVAEERQLGILEWQLTLPVTRGRQWAVKAGLAFAVGALLGVLLPATLSGAALVAGNLTTTGDEYGVFMVLAALASLAALTLAMFASSLCSTALRAALTTLVLLGAIGTVAISLLRFVLLDTFEPHLLPRWVVQLAQTLPPGAETGVQALLVGVVLAWFAGVLTLARFNYCLNDPSASQPRLQYGLVVIWSSLTCCAVPILTALSLMLRSIPG